MRPAATALMLAALSAGASASAPGPAYRGRVEAGGRPLAGAEVELLPAPGRVALATQLLLGEESPPLARTRTGSDGRFELFPPAAAPGRLRVRARGWATAEIAAVPAVDDIEVFPLALWPEREIEVTVVDPAGRPLAGRVVLLPRARVDVDACLSSLLLVLRCRWGPAAATARLDAKGTARLPAPAGRRDRLLVDADGRPRQVEVEDLERPRRRVVAPAGEPRRLRAVDRSGRPVAGAAVLAADGPIPLGLTDADGRATVYVALGGSLEVDVVGPDAAVGHARLRPPPEGAPAAAGPLAEVVLTPGSEIHGQAVDRSTGEPLAGVLVAALAAVAPTTSDAAGRWRLRIQPGDRPEVAARAPGYLAVASPVVADGETLLSLLPSAELAGRLLDREGNPIAGASVVAFQSRGPPLTALDRPEDTLLAFSDASGRFRLSGAVPGLAATLEATAPGYRPLQLNLPVAAASEPLELTLLPGVRLRGRVVDDGETPIAGARVGLGRAELPEAAGPTATSDAEGRFSFEDLAPGRWNVEVTASGFAPARVPGIAVPDSDEHDLGVVLLGAAAEIAGTVVDADGAAVAGAQVRLLRERHLAPGTSVSRGRTETTYGDGRFRFGELQPGEPLDLDVSAAGRASRRLAALTPPLDAPLRIELAAAAVLAGRVVDDLGQAVAAAWVSAFGSRGALGHRGVEAAEDGRFELEVDPGRLHLQVQAPRSLPATLDLQLAPGEERRDLVVTLRLARAVALGTVRDEDGRPPLGAQVTVQYEAAFGTFGRSAMADAGGRYRLDAPVGLAKVSALAGGASVEVEVELAPGENRVDLVLPAPPPRPTLRARVVDPGGLPVAGASVVAGGVAGTTDAGGDVELHGVEAGEPTVTVAADGFPPLTVRLEIPAAGLDGLILALEPGSVLHGRLTGLTLDEVARTGLWLRSGSSTRLAALQPDGRFRLEALPAGPATVVAVRDHGQRVEREIVIPEPPAELELELDFAGLALTGAVSTEGRPVQSAQVVVAGPGGRQETSTDWQGAFRLDGLERGPHALTVMGRYELSGLHLERTVDPAAEPTLDLELAATSVDGRLLGADGLPRAGARLVAKASEPTIAASALSDAQGAFRLGPLAPGRWTLQVVLGRTSTVDLAVVELTEAAALHDLILVVPPRPDSP